MKLQIKILGSIIQSLNKSDYPQEQKLLNALKFMNSSKETKHQLGGCWLLNKNNQIYVEKS